MRLPPGRGVAAALALSLLVVVPAGCGDDATTVAPGGRVEIVVELEKSERWHASGPLVEAGEFCAAGRRHLVAIEDPKTGAGLVIADHIDLLDGFSAPDARPDLVLVVEHVCNDGSGAFLSGENQQRGDWEFRSGTGRFTNARAQGSISFVVAYRFNPAHLFITAEVDAGSRR